MEKNQKILIGALLVVSVAVALFFALQPPSFESEYARMSRVWKEQGLGEYLHASDKLFSLSEPEIVSIKNKIDSFKAGTRNKAAASLAGAYVLLLDSAELHSAITTTRESLSNSDKPLCDNLPTYKELQEKLSQLRDKRNAYIKACNSFVADYPAEAKSISLQKTTPSKNESLEDLNEALALAEEVCK